MTHRITRFGPFELDLDNAELKRAGQVVKASPSGGGGSSPTAPAPAPPAGPRVLQVGGQYQITQQGVSDTCGQGTNIPSVSATVTHAASASTFVMADTGGTTFTGTVANDGQFNATATFGPDAGGDTFAQRLAGRFGAIGFTAQLDVQVSPRNCRFTRNWTATKQGAPNTFP